MAKRKQAARTGGSPRAKAQVKAEARATPEPAAPTRPAAVETGAAVSPAVAEVAATSGSFRTEDRDARRRDPLSRIIHLALCAFILAAPYFQGLFFEKQRFIAEIGVFLAGAVWAVATLWRWWEFQRSAGSQASWPGLGFPRGGLGLCAVGVAVAYFIAIPGAASMRSALGEALTAAMLLVVMWLVVESSRGEHDLDLVLKAISTSGIMIAGVGMATATKVFVYPSAWEGGRLFSTLQYANSAASALLASFFASATAWLKSGPAAAGGSAAGSVAGSIAGLVEKALWGFAGAFSFAGFVLTQSRAAWLVFPLVAAFFVAGSRRSRLAALACVLVGATAGIVAAARFASFLQPLNAAAAWKWALCPPVVAGAVLAVVGVLGSLGSMPHLRSQGAEPAGAAGSSGDSHPGARPGLRRLAVAAVAAGVCLALVVGVVVIGRSQAAGPLARLRSFALTDESLQSRIIWPLDAVRIALRHPITGTGGGGWALVYPRHREYPYYTKLVHNHFAQVLVDTGLVGFSVFLAFWFYLFRTAWRTIRSPEAGAGLKATVWGAAMAAAALGAHGAVDFSLSLPAVAVFLWAAAGVVYRGSEAAAFAAAGVGAGAGPRGGRGVLAEALSHLERALSGRGGRRIAAAACLLAMLVTCSLALSGVYATRAVQAWAQKKPDEAVALLRTAARLDPLSGPIRADLGQWYEALAGARRDRDLAKRCIDSFAAAVALSPYDSPIRLHYAAVLFNSGQTAAAIQNAQVAIANNKFLPLGYEVLTGLYVESGKRLALAGRVDDAKKAFSMALDVLGALEKANASIPERYRRFIRPEARLAPTTTMGVYRAQAKFFLGQREAMYEDLKPALADPDPVVKARALFWEAMMVAATGDHSTAGLKLREALKVSPELADEGPRTKEIAARLGLDYKLEPRSR